MKRIEIIVEGQTEQEFVKSVLAPYLYAHGVSVVTPICIRTSATGRGGFTNYEYLRNDINLALSSKDKDLVVSMLVDYFRIKTKRMPRYDDWKDIKDHFHQVEEMERAIGEDIGDRRFIPYIQMHEFEALLFSSVTGAQKYWSKDKANLMSQIIDKFDTPECINTNPDGAPSKRLLKIAPDYQKNIDGNVFALEIGIDVILERCPRFAAWVSQLINM